MKIVITKYNAGNIQSVKFALERAGIMPVVSDDEHELRSADKIIFPGVGEASTAMKYLQERSLDKIIPTLKQPVLGICLGQQLMCATSEENNATCLGIFDIPVKKFTQPNGQHRYKIPHMGWSPINHLDSSLFNKLPKNPFVYFVHSFYAPVCEYTIAQCQYANNFSAALHKDNFYATQFHPEKSGGIGAKISQNFLDL